MANFGSEVDFRTRSDFARHFLAAGGIDVSGEAGFHSIDEILSAFGASGCRLVVIASSAERYAEILRPLAEGLRARGALVVVVGRPGRHAGAWREAGVAHTIHRGCDALEVLAALHSALEN